MRRAAFMPPMTVAVIVCSLFTLSACGSGTDDPGTGPVPVDPTVQWEAIVPSPELPSEAAGRVAVPNTADFTLTGLDPSTGRALWLRALPVGTVGVTGFGDVFVAAKEAAVDSTALTVIDPISGYDLWSVRVSTAQAKLVLRVGSTLVAQVNDSILVGLDRTSGREGWRTRLAPLTCTTQAGCGKLTPIGVDRGDGYILRQSSTEAQVITVRESGVIGQVVAQSAVLRRVSSPDEVTAVVGTGSIAVASGGDVAGVDPLTGAERWRTALSTLVPSSYSTTPTATRFTFDGTLLLALMSDATTAREVVIGLTNGQQVRQRPIPKSQLTSISTRCGLDGYAYLVDNGFEYVDIRTGVVSTVNRPGLLATINGAALTNAFPTANGYVVYSTKFSRAGRHIGVKCTP